MRPHTKAFHSCLLLSARDAPTLPFVRALHGAGIAVLERDDDALGLQLARSGEFDMVAVVCSDDCDGTGVGRIAGAGPALFALFHHASSECVSASLLAGADACLQLDADERVIAAQVKAVLRRYGAFDQQVTGSSGLLQVGDLCVDVDRCEVQRAGVNVALTAMEFRIIEFMAHRPRRMLRSHEIMNAVTDDYEYLPREAQDVLKVYVRRIRRKLEVSENEPAYLITVRGFGYRLEGGAQSADERRTVVATA